MFGLSLQLTPSQKQEMEVTCKMASCDSIFPAVEAWLQTTTDHQESLKYVAKRKKMDRYVCMVDFLVGEIFEGNIRKACFKFYEDEGDPLREQIDGETREKMEMILLFVLTRAYKTFKDKREMSWRAFVEESKTILLAA